MSGEMRTSKNPGRINARVPRLHFWWPWGRSARIWKAGHIHRRGYREAELRAAAVRLIHLMFDGTPEQQAAAGITVLAKAPADG